VLTFGETWSLETRQRGFRSASKHLQWSAKLGGRACLLRLLLLLLRLLLLLLLLLVALLLVLLLLLSEVLFTARSTDTEPVCHSIDRV
jgi:hypothetical protein